MKGTTAAAVLLVGTVFLIMLSLSAGSTDGADAMEGTFYCYGDNPEIIYPYDLPPGVTVSWSAETPDGTPVICNPATGISTKLNLTGLSEVIVTQTLTDGATTKVGKITVKPMHIGDQTYAVRFIDGVNVFDVKTIDKTTVCEEGDNFFTLPSAPTKSGYSFEGWYVGDTTVKAETITKTPVTGNIDIYAKWSGSGPVGPTRIIVDEVFVFFKIDTGIECNILTKGSGIVTFTVNEIGGFDMKMETLKVTVGDEEIFPSGGVYIVTGIRSETTITITCDRVEPEPPPAEKFEFPWWILMPAGLIVLSLLFIRQRGKGVA